MRGLTVNWAFLAAMLVAACAAPRPSETAITPDPAWTDTLMPLLPAVGLRGGDGAASHSIPGGRTLWLFGDSWIGRVEGGRYAPGAAMPNNVVLVHATPPPHQAGGHADESTVQVAYGPTPKPGVYSAFVMPDDAEPGHPKWCWPCDGAVTIGAVSAPKLAIFYADLMQRVEHPKPGSPDDVWNFRLMGNRIAVVENPVDAPGEWRMTQHALGPRDPARFHNGSPAISWGVVAMREPATAATSEPFVLVHGVDGSNTWDKLIMLARVPESRLTEFGAWRFRTDAPADSPRAWSDRESEAAPIAHNGVDEFTILPHRFGRFDGWVLIQGEPMLGHHILVRTAASLWGPWSEGRAIYTIPEPATDKNLITYGAKAHPHLSGPGELLISYCINSTDFGQMARDVDIYRPRFIRVPLGVIEGK